MVGGRTNCPRCGQATEVPGLHDPFWRAIQVSAVVLWAVAVYLSTSVFGLGLAGAVTVGLVGAGVLWLLGRVF